MTDVEITIGFWRKPGMNLVVFPLSDVCGDDVADEIRGGGRSFKVHITHLPQRYYRYAVGLNSI